jgi:hypothetical protein
MLINQTNIQSIMQADFSQAYQTIDVMAALQSELATLQAKVVTYYHDEVVLRGDKVMMREYCGHFGIEPANPGM